MVCSALSQRTLASDPQWCSALSQRTLASDSQWCNGSPISMVCQIQSEHLQGGLVVFFTTGYKGKRSPVLFHYSPLSHYLPPRSPLVFSGPLPSTSLSFLVPHPSSLVPCFPVPSLQPPLVSSAPPSLLLPSLQPPLVSSGPPSLLPCLLVPYLQPPLISSGPPSLLPCLLVPYLQPPLVSSGSPIPSPLSPGPLPSTSSCLFWFPHPFSLVSWSPTFNLLLSLLVPPSLLPCLLVPYLQPPLVSSGSPIPSPLSPGPLPSTSSYLFWSPIPPPLSPGPLPSTSTCLFCPPLPPTSSHVYTCPLGTGLRPPPTHFQS
ncbi:uncharacterized protein LOC135353116 [Latimeria chalumnae]|uniref:uncharacterized protein LOC135353116 n=1 Tax=Latimeria chalumnae TaxID=7897 RepID=UPI00313E62BC